VSDLTPKQAQFVREYLIDLNATQAAIRTGYSAKTAYSQGQRLLRDVEIAKALAEAQAARSERTEITADMVLQELWAIGRANPNELIEYRRACCRHCWGEGHRHQYTEGEMATRRAAHDKKSGLGSDAEAWDADGMFDEGGGIGFDARKEPSPDCPECFGQGVGVVYAKDTRKLSPDAAKLYAGVKITKDGLEIKMHDKVGALTQVGRHLGMFTDKLNVDGDITVELVNFAPNSNT
jgi:phage terminase small subunit